MMDQIKRTKFNVCLLGEGHVGKTCIVTKYIKNTFDDHMLMTVGVDNCMDSATFDGAEYKIKIFDTAGQERYRSVSTNLISLSDGFFVVYAVNDRKSFECIDNWINTIEERCNLKNKVLILVGNKIDLEKRQVTKEEATQFAEEKNLKYFETSAKTGDGIKEIFKELYTDIYKKFKENENMSNGDNQNINESPTVELDKNKVIPKKDKKSGCC